ncbi:hypothetical protein [Paenibacillus cucumis (ex Kampfer et al. 2016)]|uniref:DUF2313 domain-containing protein n=1 Tax=Paenibacillus cucumis (ex Kampfer et al. 2016) TaxID=1776858 RepID=A0ABS7KK04_9BACL|nr:hypothetical protein [Paenibacillus cucumis (ex Kampfer et al. 2016)]MBY0204435.1 hypothetical protein [Paenibacillus cucumis (ex Kampfer et al. 2016)]
MYEKMIAPFEVVPFELMTKLEARTYLGWFTSEIPKRIEVLRAFYHETTGSSPNDLDLSEKSLGILWRWFIPQITMVPKTAEELEEEISMTPEWLRDEVLKENSKKFSEETSSIIIDIGIYFGTVFINLFSSLDWGVVHTPKNYVYVNRPVIKGFGKVEMNPIAIVYNISLRYLRNRSNERQLIDVFNVWKEYL